MARTPQHRRHTGVRRTTLAALLLAFRVAGAHAAAEPQDLTALPFEQLLSLEVYSASKFTQKASQAPASVTVISAADIRAYGWRTLADVLRSVRGLYVSYDRNYSYLGARGFLRPGDYNTRFLLQIDGNRVNDPVYDQAPLGAEFPLDLELIERIEYVPGPGSSIYGANAFFGVINVITRRVRDVEGTHVALSGGQSNAARASASHAWRDGRGTELLLSASSQRDGGRDLYFAEFDTPGQNGVAHGLDYENGQRLYAKAASGPFSLSLLHAERRKGVPTASFGQAFDDPRSRTVDKQQYANAGYRAAPAANATLDARLFWGSYESVGDYIAATPQRTLNRDGSNGRWWGAEATLVTVPAAGHKLLAGAEFQHDYRLAQYSYDIAPYLSYLQQNHRDQRYGLYLQDEVELGRDLLLNAGVRYDHHSGAGGVFNPRVALIYEVTPSTTVKAVHGSAFRAPNNYELYYQFFGAGGQLANPALTRERIRSNELALVQQLRHGERLTLTLFRNRVSDLISQVPDSATDLPVFANTGAAQALGIEAEYERHWSNAATLRASYSVQRVRQQLSDATVNSPRQLGKINLALPLHGPWRAGLEGQVVTRRDTAGGGSAAGYALLNLNLFSLGLTRHVDLALSAYNLLDRRYADPVSEQQLQQAITQDGRRLRFKLSYAY
ncbi:MAG: TonB-dependent receptor [Pseudomonadota bacterium]